MEWGEFWLKDLFKINRGKRLKKDNHLVGKIPYISSTNLNNGVNNFISNIENVRFFSNSLSIANSGSVGSTFYHPYTFIASDHITNLSNHHFNKFSYIFASNLLQNLKEKYFFNREINDKRIKREKILLPIDKNGEPDYKFMENFIKQEMKKQILKIIDYFSKGLD
ncbi:restriction endonuclease subunit S [Campylobacter corcagiensis]|uniref:Restriction endonuclease subunit S n=1 Tax=Campylobacter corcagiensis TaxID=1448857 RepID=A0A7M1LHX4_9BACT|nr:restriction endonuclease subunit S [Campylobacter corcagiensis]QOQ88189.1 restriction endonuclease subunit S [Campylobacter corcagiensis]